MRDEEGRKKKKEEGRRGELRTSAVDEHLVHTDGTERGLDNVGKGDAGGDWRGEGREREREGEMRKKRGQGRRGGEKEPPLGIEVLLGAE